MGEDLFDGDEDDFEAAFASIIGDMDGLGDDVQVGTAEQQARKFLGDETYERVKANREQLADLEVEAAKISLLQAAHGDENVQAITQFNLALGVRLQAQAVFVGVAAVSLIAAVLTGVGWSVWAWVH